MYEEATKGFIRQLDDRARQMERHGQINKAQYNYIKQGLKTADDAFRHGDTEASHQIINDINDWLTATGGQWR
jgi:hypothetical protein